MGKPKFSRKKYETPSHPWQEDRIKAENELIKKYGLKNKREIWKAETSLRKYRGQARELLARVSGGDVQSKTESDQLLTHLSRMNILPPKSNLDDVLALETESILSRRLQTLTYLKGLANTPDQARQLISHGHIAIGDRRVTVPGYMVTNVEEGEIGYTTDSPLNDLMHPARPRGDYKAPPVKKDTKPKEEVKEDKAEEKPADGKAVEEKAAEPATEEKPPEAPAEPEQKEEQTADEPQSEPEPTQEPPQKEEQPPVEEPEKTDEPPKEEKKPAEEDKKDEEKSEEGGK